MGPDHSPPLAQPLDFWLARGAVLVVVALQLLIVNDLSVGPRWLAPALELALLIPLSVATAWVHGRARRATTDEHVHMISRHRRAVRRAAVGLTALVTVMNFGALILLVRALVGGRAGNGQILLLDALNVWGTNVVVFALWYWAVDRGGPGGRGLARTRTADFLFPQMAVGGERHLEWSPGFLDYLFLSYTTAVAFSPADTMPLTPRAKLLMMAESATSLVTIGLVAARAVGILA